MLRRVSFILLILGLFGLFVFALKDQVEINGLVELEELELNTKVMIKGIVENERDFGEFRILNINGIEVVCKCYGKFKGFEVEVIGFIEEYESLKQIRVLEILRS
jgi:hypothetical protein